MRIKSSTAGFTLIEMSIVLVIIGLVIGGVLVGRNLISAATVRAQISQIEKYNTAVNTFRSKYGYLPGDIPDPYATQYGFAARGTLPGEGDGGGVLHGVNFYGADPTGQAAGETVMFWADLAQASLIEGAFNTATAATPAYNLSAAALAQYFPAAKIGAGNAVIVWSGGVTGNNMMATPPDGKNYYSVAIVNSSNGNGELNTTPGLTVSQAYAIDTKIDDGFPQLGKVLAYYIDTDSTMPCCVSGYWAAGGHTQGANSGAPTKSVTTNPTAASATTCYDNGSVAGVQKYSMGQNDGAGVNCALSFSFQ